MEDQKLYEFGELLNTPNLSPNQRLKTAELCLELIESKSLRAEDVGTVYQLLRGLEPPAELTERAARLEIPHWRSGEPTFLTDRFTPSQFTLLQLCSANLTPEMAGQIALADMGYGIDQHLEQIGLIQSKGFGPNPIEWHPLEVLELTRFSEPNHQGWNQNEGHQIRAFCCAALITAATTSINKGIVRVESDTLIQVIESVLELQNGLPHATVQLLLYAIPRLSDHARIAACCGLMLLTLQPSVLNSTRHFLQNLTTYVKAEFDASEKDSAELTEALNAILTHKWTTHFAQVIELHRDPRLIKLISRVLP